MKLERRAKSRRSGRGCGCALLSFALICLALVSLILLAPSLPALLLRFAGFSAAGPSVTAPPSVATPAASGILPSASASFSSDDYGPIHLPTASYHIVAGADSTGSTLIQAAFEVDALRQICLSLSDFCSDAGNPVRKASFAIDGGQLILSGEVFIDIFNAWQPMDLQLTPGENAYFRIQSLMINGVAWQVPDNAFGAQIQALAAEVNLALGGLRMRVDGASYRLERLALDEAHLVAVFVTG